MIPFYYSLNSKVPDYESVSIKQLKHQQQQKLLLPVNLGEMAMPSADNGNSSNDNGGGGSGPNSGRTGSSNGTHQSGSESERVRQCGNLFDRRATINQELLDEFFRREPCPYSKFLFYIKIKIEFINDNFFLLKY
jgi:hypothetical protein